MKSIKNLVKEFNQPGTLVVISSYPAKEGEPAKLNAVACYVGNLLKAYKGCKIVVLAEIIEQPEIYRQGNVLIYRCWERDSLLLYWQLLNGLHIFNQPKQILFQFEFNMLGIVSVTGLLPFFLAIVKLLGKEITLVQHQVVANLNSLSGHLGLKKRSLRAKILTSGLQVFYRSLGIAVDKIIVHEEVLKKRLSAYIRPEKITVISHGLTLGAARKKIREKDFVLLLFGYLTWYKGTDWLIHEVGELAKKYPEWRLKLIVAGGPSATLKTKPHYQSFLKKVRCLAADYRGQVKVTGYVPDDQVAKYFRAADLVVLPYRTMMSASGPFSFTLQFNKPFILSTALSKGLENKDAKAVLRRLDLSAKEIVFSLQDNDFEEKLARLIREKVVFKKLGRLSAGLRQWRSWESVVAQYQRVLDEKRPALLVSQIIRNLARVVISPLGLIIPRRIVIKSN